MSLEEKAVSNYSKALEGLPATMTKVTQRQRYLALVNRGICYQKLSKHDLALEDFT